MPASHRLAVAGLLLTGLLLTGCSSHGNHHGALAPVPAPSAANGPDRQAAVDTAPSTAGSTAGPAAGPVSAPAIADPAAVIRTAEIALTLPDAGGLARQSAAAAGIATAAGGSVYAEHRTDTAATLVLKVPPAALPAVLDRLAALGREQSRQLGSRTVTAQVADVDARLASARASLARLQQLFAQARTVTEVLAVENDLASRQAALEALEAQQRALAAQTDLATVTATLTVAAGSSSRHGFAAGLHDGWAALVGTGRAVAATAGAVLPFLPLVAVVGVVAIAGWRRRRGSGRSPRPTRA